LLVLGTRFDCLLGAMCSHGSAFQKSEESTHFAPKVKAQPLPGWILTRNRDA
jgi:hypothetical protein